MSDLATPGGLSPVVELRQYTLHPGQRDVLVDLFDAEFVETQESVGMAVIGQFRDLDRADRFVWLRGFRDMTQRAQSLSVFYDGPVWKQHRDAANATMIDSDDVLLLRPAWHGSAFALGNGARRQGGVTETDLVEATIFHLEPGAQPNALVERIERTFGSEAAEQRSALLGCFVTEPSENTFPRLPVREGENVVVVFAGHTDGAAGSGVAEVGDALSVERPAETLRLAPTPRSWLTGRSPACDAGELGSMAPSGEEKR